MLTESKEEPICMADMLFLEKCFSKLYHKNLNKESPTVRVSNHYLLLIMNHEYVF